MKKYADSPRATRNPAACVQIVAMTCLLLVILTAAAPNPTWAVSSYTSSFNSTYGTSGARGLNTIGSCITCHPGALNGSSTLNNYSRDWLKAARNFSAVESLDSDADGHTNIAEIRAGTFPGDISSMPAPPAGLAPVANAGSDQSVRGETAVSLNGSGSYDPDGTISTFKWLQTGGTSVILSNAAGAETTFTAPAATAAVQTLTFTLTVQDNSQMQDSDTCRVTIAAGNQPPVADAGADQSVVAGQTVFLDGLGSSDADGQIQTYRWSQTSGAAVPLSDADSARAFFSAPDPGVSGVSLTFQLTVTDDRGGQSAAECIITITGGNRVPLAHAGGDGDGRMTVEEGGTVMLDGAASMDADGRIVSYTWEQIGGGPVVILSDTRVMQPTFVTPVVDAAGAVVVFRLTVQDDGGLMASDQVAITITDNSIAGFADGVLPVMTTTGEPVGLAPSSGGAVTGISPVAPGTLGTAAQSVRDMYLGLLEIEAKPAVTGAMMTITLHLSEPAPAGYSWYKYNPADDTWTDYGIATDPDGRIGAVFNADRNQVTLTLIDGGLGDDDGLANGIIVDPGGLGTAAAVDDGNNAASDGTPGANDFGLDSGGCFIRAAAGRLVNTAILPLGLALLTLLPAVCQRILFPGPPPAAERRPASDLPQAP